MIERNAERVLNKLEDDLSRAVFNIRMNYLCTQDRVIFAESILKICPDMHFGEIDTFLANNQLSHLCIVGKEDNAKYTYSVLERAGYSVNICEDVNEITLDDEVGFLVFDKQLQEELIKHEIDCHRIFYHSRHFTGRTGWQYFDVFTPKEQEVFADIGAFSGDTASDFVRWCSGNYNQILLFEPNPFIIEKCQQRIQQEAIEHVVLYPVALSNKKGREYFQINESFPYTAKLNENGEHMVDVVTMDEVCKDIPISFIKIDAEGEEKNIIEGAKNIINKYHPRMAVSVYHHLDDFVKLANQLLDIYPDYRLAFRHYHTDTNETILYLF